MKFFLFLFAGLASLSAQIKPLVGTYLGDNTDCSGTPCGGGGSSTATKWLGYTYTYTYTY